MPLESEKKFVGIEIGGTKLQLVVGDAAGTIEQSLRYTIHPAKGAVDIQTQIAAGIQQLKLENVSGIGVGFGGPVNWKTGTIQVSHQVTGWDGFDLKTWLEELTGKPAAVENDANVAALAEAVYGSGKNYALVFYMTIGSGIGGGMIIQKKIYHGAVPGEAEIGHIRLEKSGTTLEEACSGWAVNERVKKAIQSRPDGMLAQLASNGAGAEAVFLKPALEQNDPATQQIITEVSDNIAFALSHVVHLFHPDVIVIGGGLSFLGEHLRTPIVQSLSSYVMNAFLPPPQIKFAALGEQVVPIGALELAKITQQKDDIRTAI